MFDRRFAFAAALSATLAGPAFADWSANLITLGQTTAGATGAVACPAGGTPGMVWGTGTYTSDSSICTAAAHFGWIQPATGGQVSYQVVPGLQSYQGSAQNGITSNDYGTWDLSFQITGAQPLAGPPVTPSMATPIGWGDTPDSLGIAGMPGATHGFFCPPGGAATAPIWGTDVYTSDSAICVAATHRGLIQPAQGGPVVIMILGNQPAYGGSTRNGVTASSYPEWGRSYVFQ